MSRDATFRAIADPTRRRILELLATSDQGMSLVALADNFDSSRQAVTKHVKLLCAAGLVTMEKRGREQLCRAVPPAGLESVKEWLAEYDRFWQQKLADLGQYLDAGGNGE